MEKIRKILLKNLLPILAGVIMVGGIIYAWTEPTTAPPGNNVPAPINIGATTQTKQGGDICVNIGEVTKCLSTGGGDLSNVRVGPPGCNNILTFSATCYTQACMEYSTTAYVPAGPYSSYISVPATMYFTCGGSCSAGSPMSCSTAGVGADFLSGANHSTDSCTVAGGEVMQDGSDKFCKFTASSCPSGWTQFKNWSATTAKTCTGTTNDNTNCPVSSCTANGHTFANITPESCSYKSSRSWTSQTCYYDCGTYHCLCSGCYIYGCDPTAWDAAAYNCAYTGWGWYWDPNCPGCVGYSSSWDSCSYGYDTCSYDCPYCNDSSATCYADKTAVGCY